MLQSRTTKGLVLFLRVVVNLFRDELCFSTLYKILSQVNISPSLFESAVIRKRRRRVESRLLGDKLNDAFPQIRPRARRSRVVKCPDILVLTELDI